MIFAREFKRILISYMHMKAKDIQLDKLLYGITSLGKKQLNSLN